jgi:2'-5' RNA ligase
MGRPPSLVRTLARRLASRARRSLGIERAASLARPEVAFVLPLGDEAHNFMTELQVEILRRHGCNEGLTAAPHITLKLGFKTADLGPFAGYLDELARSTPPFEITMRGISSFEDGIIFLDVEPSASLDQLRRRIVRELSERFQIEPRPLEGDQFHFHATLAYGLPRKAFEEELALLSRMTPSFRFQAQTLAMLCHTGDHWITYRRAALPERPSRDRVV